ncbi:hypothetical protein AKO1_010888, partial [Acrasis kona]
MHLHISKSSKVRKEIRDTKMMELSKSKQEPNKVDNSNNRSQIPKSPVTSAVNNEQKKDSPSVNNNEKQNLTNLNTQKLFDTTLSKSPTNLRSKSPTASIPRSPTTRSPINTRSTTNKSPGQTRSEVPTKNKSPTPKRPSNDKPITNETPKSTPTPQTNINSKIVPTHHEETKTHQQQPANNPTTHDDKPNKTHTPQPSNANYPSETPTETVTRKSPRQSSPGRPINKSPRRSPERTNVEQSKSPRQSPGRTNINNKSPRQSPGRIPEQQSNINSILEKTINKSPRQSPGRSTPTKSPRQSPGRSTPTKSPQRSPRSDIEPPKSILSNGRRSPSPNSVQFEDEQSRSSVSSKVSSRGAPALNITNEALVEENITTVVGAENQVQFTPTIVQIQAPTPTVRQFSWVKTIQPPEQSVYGAVHSQQQDDDDDEYEDAGMMI